MAMTTPAALSISIGNATTRGSIGINPGSYSATVKWICPHGSYQAQIRTRKRLKPSYAASLSSDDIYSAWDGEDFDSAWSEPTAKSSTTSSGDAVTLSQPISATLGGNYDLVQHLIRVRSYNSSTGEVSAWCSTVFTVSMVPTVTASVTRKDDGSLWFNGAMSNYERGCSVKLVQYGDGHPSQTATGLSNSFSFKMDDAIVKGVADDAETMTISHVSVTTDDGASKLNPNGGSYSVSRDGSESASISVMAMGAVSIDGVPYLQAKETSSELVAESVIGSLSWVDADGVRFKSECVYSAGSNGWWTSDSPLIPYGVGVTQTVVARFSGGWASDSEELDAGSVYGDPSIRLDRDGESFTFDAGIGTQPTYERTISNDCAVAAIDGKSKPVSRYGGMVSAKWTLTGAIPKESLSDAYRLSGSGDWLLRTPHGHRVNVCIESVSVQLDESGWYSLKVTANEVE